MSLTSLFLLYASNSIEEVGADWIVFVTLLRKLNGLAGFGLISLSLPKIPFPEKNFEK
jgi:hypothetical protein